MISLDLGVWIGAFLTLAALSFLYRENIVFEFSEKTFIGASLGFAVVIGIKNIISMAWTPLGKGEYLYIIPLILGFLVFTRVSKKVFWVSRYPLAIIVGVGTGVSMRGAIGEQIVTQIAATSLSVITPDVWKNLDNAMMIIMVTTALFYFYFSKEFKNPVPSTAQQIGRYVLMAAFGASFGSTVMARMTLLIGRLQFLLLTWLGLG